MLRRGSFEQRDRKTGNATQVIVREKFIKKRMGTIQQVARELKSVNVD